MPTRIITTHKDGRNAKRKQWAKKETSKVHRTHKGYPMRTIVKKQLTFKRKGRKR